MLEVSIIDWVFEAPITPFGPGERRLRMTPEEAIRKIAELGFRGVDLAIWDVDEWPDSRVKRIKDETLIPYNLKVPSICFNDPVTFYKPGYSNPDEKIRRDIVRRAEKSMKVANELGSRVIAIWPGSDPVPKRGYWNAWRYFIDTVIQIARKARDYGMLVALEYKPENIIYNVDSTLRAIEQISMDNVGALIDTGHAIIAKEDLETAVDMLGRKLFFVHIDDNPGDWDRDMPPGTVHNFEPFIRALRDVGYDGFLSLDLFSEDPVADAKRSKEYLERIIRSLY